MSKLASRLSAHRTGQNGLYSAPMAQKGSSQVAVVTADGSTVVGTPVNGSNGGCGPARATTLNSWGSGCPPGFCTAEQLANSLGRAVAGERYPCREIPYWVSAVATAGGLISITQNSTVTICPTRIVVAGDDGVGIPIGASLSVFEIGNQNQIIGDPLPALLLAPGSYAPIPFVTDCMRAGLPFSIQGTGFTAAQNVYIALIGPAIG